MHTRFNATLGVVSHLLPPPPGANTAIPDIRQAQEKALELTDVGMATAIDLGDPTSPEGTAHRRDRASLVGIAQRRC
jgi:hypothetical protein